MTPPPEVPPETPKRLALAEWRMANARARQAADAIGRSTEDDRLSISSSYYTMLHCARAAAVVETGMIPRSHNGATTVFGRLCKETGESTRRGTESAPRRGPGHRRRLSRPPRPGRPPQGATPVRDTWSPATSPCPVPATSRSAVARGIDGAQPPTASARRTHTTLGTPRARTAGRLQTSAGSPRHNDPSGEQGVRTHCVQPREPEPGYRAWVVWVAVWPCRLNS